MRPLGIAVLIGLASGAAGCVLPPAFTIASFVADGLSVASTGKTVTDHAISLLAHRDCRLWRLVQGKSICGAATSVVAVATLPKPLPLRAASPGFAPPAMVASVAPAEAPVVEPAAPTPTVEPASASVEPAPQEKPTPAPVPSPPKAASSSPIATVAPVTPSPGAKIAPAPAVPLHQAVSPSIVPAAPAPPPVRHVSAGDSRVRGEMIIRSGTDEAEARALAQSLNAVGAFVRPVRHGDITIYEVVMGLSG
jgi:hypothetical protein